MAGIEAQLGALTPRQGNFAGSLTYGSGANVTNSFAGSPTYGELVPVSQTDGSGNWVGPSGPSGNTQQAGPTPEQIKLQQDEQTRQALKGNVGGIIQGLTGIYDQLYGAINSGVGEAGQRLQERYTKETGALGDTFN